MSTLDWGVVAYAGNLYDPAMFDGWYSCECLAEEAARHWQTQLPGWAVSVVARRQRLERPGAASQPI